MSLNADFCRALACTLLLCTAAELLSSNANLELASSLLLDSPSAPFRVGEPVTQAVLACYAARALISDAHNCVLSRACLRNGFIRFPPCTATQSSDFTFLCAQRKAHTRTSSNIGSNSSTDRSTLSGLMLRAQTVLLGSTTKQRF